jgi:hypothetical protein
MFGKLRLIGRGARAPEGARGAENRAQEGRAGVAAQRNASDLDKVSVSKALAARVLAHRTAWHNALPGADRPANATADDAPRPAVTEPQPPKGAAPWGPIARD